MATRERISVGSLIDEIEEARLQAVALGQPSTAVTASMSKARLAGLLVDRKETGAPGEFSRVANAEEVLAKVAAELGDETAAALRAALAAPEVEPEPVDQVESAVQRAPGDTLN